MNNKTFLRRNLDLWKDRKIHGRMFTELSVKYAITPVRCRQIYNKVDHRYQLYMLKDLKGIPMYKRKFEELEVFYFNKVNYFRKELEDVSSDNKNDKI